MPKRRTTASARYNARLLRQNQTPSEFALWKVLKSLQLNGIHFRRQHPIGGFVVDFCAPRKKLIIELDGSQHLEQEDQDLNRTTWLESKGYKVLRFWNDDVTNNLNGVYLTILEALQLNDD